MKRSIMALLGLAALGALPVSAGPAWQAGISLNFNGSTTVTYSGTLAEATIKRDGKMAPALFAGYRVYDFGSSEISVTGEVQFQTRYPLIQGPNRDSLRSQFYAPGAQWTWHGTVDAGAGLQFRFTDLKFQNVSTSNNRVWLHGTIGKTFDLKGSLSPFVNLRLAYALGRTSPPTADYLNNGGDAAVKQLMKTLDGDSEVAVQFGVRF